MIVLILIASLVVRYLPLYHTTSPHPELNIPCEADLSLPYIRLLSVLPFLQSLPCVRVFHLSLYTASFLTAIGMRYYHVPIAHSLKAWLLLSGQRGTDVLHRPIYIISFLNQSSNTQSAMKTPSFSRVINSLSMRAFLMRSILDLLPSG